MKMLEKSHKRLLSDIMDYIRELERVIMEVRVKVESLTTDDYMSSDFIIFASQVALLSNITKELRKICDLPE